MIKKYTNYPKKVSYDYYSKARSEFIGSLKKNVNILSIYEYGKVRAPGVSDLDLIIVFKNKIKGKITFNKLNIGPKALSLVKYGTIIKTTEKIFKQFQFIDKFNLKKIFGKKILLIKPGEKIKNTIKLISILDFVPERILRVDNFLNKNFVKIDSALNILNSLGYSLKLLEKITKKKRSSKLLRNVKKLRESWYLIKDPEKKLLAELKKIKMIGIELLFYYQKFLEGKNLYLKKNSYKLVKKDIKLEIYNNNFIVFRKINTLKELKKINAKNKKNSSVKVYVPLFLYPHFDTIINFKGYISKNTKKRLSDNVGFSYLMNKNYKRSLFKKISLMEKNYKFLKFHKLQDGLIRYGFYYEKLYR